MCGTDTGEETVMEYIRNEKNVKIAEAICEAIHDNAAYLSEIDGAIGDGDHGMNMNKGFTLFADRFAEEEFGFSEGMEELGMILFNEIGGSMGPIYGTIFMSMAETLEDTEEIGISEFAGMLEAGLKNLQDIVEAQVGDKTLVDTLSPAVDTMKKAAEENRDFSEALSEMIRAAENGRDSTKDLVAKVGRSSRLGERSRGVLDAGSVSCCLLLTAMAESVQDLLK